MTIDITKHWYSRSWLSWALLPLSFIFCFAAWFRRLLYCEQVLTVEKLPSPVIVVGNITTGGSGKTPFVIWLAQWLQHKGWRPGVVSRGYGRRNPHTTRNVHSDSSPDEVGDEPLLVSLHTGCPVVVGSNRVAAVNRLVNENQCDIVISDDGLQHYAMARILEIAIVDANRGFGNGWCLPAGPLREPVSRLKSCDLVINNYKTGKTSADSKGIKYLFESMCRVDNPETRLKLKSLEGSRAHAIAGIADNQQFFRALEAAGIDIIPHGFRDHHPYEKQDIVFGDGCPVIMTEKDAVKCREIIRSVPGTEHEYWYLPIQVTPLGSWQDQLEQLLEEKTHGQKTA